MQSACIGTLLEIAEKDSGVLYLTADSGEGGLDVLFRMNFPDRSFNFGIAENVLVGAAAGMAAAGKTPFVYTAAPFLVYRSYEFLRNDVCLQDLNVKFIGTGSGLSVSTLGPTHHTTEDISALRALPNLMILSPATPKEARAAMLAAYGHEGPVYIRLGAEKAPEFYEGELDSVENFRAMREGSDIAIFSTGDVLSEAMRAAELLEGRGISAKIINVPVLKPFDGAKMLEAAGTCRTIVSLEEHNVMGGLGSMIAEELASGRSGHRLIRIGLEDRFSVGYGTIENVRGENGVSAECIADKAAKGFEDERIEI